MTQGLSETHGTAAASGIPAGAVMSFAMETPPAGWLECDGASIVRADFVALFDALGVTYGNVDGSTFNIPDLRGQFIRGWDNSAGSDPDAAGRTDRGDGTTGDEVGTQQPHDFDSHKHECRVSSSLVNGTTLFTTTANTGVGFGAVTYMANTGGNETRPININMLYCIKT